MKNLKMGKYILSKIERSRFIIKILRAETPKNAERILHQIIKHVEYEIKRKPMKVDFKKSFKKIPVKIKFKTKDGGTLVFPATKIVSKRKPMKVDFKKRVKFGQHG